MKEFLTIKKFSELSGIEESTLRYYDEIGLFSPAKRDKENNYRLYSPEQIIAVNFITVLSGLNIPLKTIGEMMDKRTPEGIMRLIEQQQKQLDMEMQRLRECYSVIHERMELIQYGTRLQKGYKVIDGWRVDDDAELDGGDYIDENSISILKRNEKAYILGQLNEFAEGELFYEPFMRFCNSAKDLRINLNYPIGGYHENMKHFLDSPGKPNRFFSLDPTGNLKRAAGEYLIGFKRGYYGEMGDLPGRMAAYATENALTVTGPVYVMYLHDEICIKEPTQYLAQVSVAVKRKKALPGSGTYKRNAKPNLP
ncbi:MAG: MerR family transcriptional regulator [Lachnospiraceae bacterium]|nr:MerR family transcriptional regulator [Lachnospiraceae bacterium]